MRRIYTFFILTILLALAMTVSVHAQGKPQNVATHIIVFKPNVHAQSTAAQLASAHGLQVTHIYRHALNGVAAVVPNGRLNALKRDPRVAYVEENKKFYIQAQTIPTGLDRAYVTNDPASPALDIDGIDDWRVDVDIAVIDTGIDFEHPDLNVLGGVDCTGGSPLSGTCNLGGDDDHYHGTHVAGTIGALDNNIGVVGVAPGARLWAVKVLQADGGGYTSWIIAGMDWVVTQGNIEVANMSLGSAGISSAYETAVNNAVNNGVVMVVAAGNSNQDANGFSPAFVPAAITVSALADFDGIPGGLGSPTCSDDEDDTLAWFSNWGSAVDIAAPGFCILSTFPIEQGEYGTISGTSMAAPHVAGAAGLLASGSNAPQNAADVQAIRDKLVNNGNYNWIDDSGDGIQEPLLDLRGFSATLIPSNALDNQAPVADFTYSCTDLNCNFDASASSDSDGSIVSYSWNFGDANSGSGITPNHVFVAAGTYTVTLTVTDNFGATGVSSQSVTVTAPNLAPVADFTYSCTDLNCNFDASASSDSDGSIVSYSWNFGDANSGSGITPNHAFAAAGTYTVTLTVTDNFGATGVSSQSVTVTAPNLAPVADFTYSCTDLSCNFDASASSDSDGTVAGFAWGFGDGAIDIGINPSHIYPAAGSYSVMLTVTDNDGAADTITKTISVTQSVSANTIFVADLDGKLGLLRRSSSFTRSWKATATVVIRDVNGNLVKNATVQFKITGETIVTSTTSCVTNTYGQCSVSIGFLGNNTFVKFSVTNVSANGYIYDASLNSDPDGDSDGTHITIYN